jgi:hypothetical protein
MTVPLWVFWLVPIALGFWLIWYDGTYGRQYDYQLLPNGKTISGCLLILATICVGLGVVLAKLLPIGVR